MRIALAGIALVSITASGYLFHTKGTFYGCIKGCSVSSEYEWNYSNIDKGMEELYERIKKD